jgi:hypothetical protein
MDAVAGLLPGTTMALQIFTLPEPVHQRNLTDELIRA